MKTLLVDGSNLAVRCWRGMAELNTSKGLPVHVIFGVLRAIKSTVQTFKCDSVVAVWDGHPAVRKAIFSGYKEKRHQAREDETEDEKLSYAQFQRQVSDLKSILGSFGIAQYYEANTEADDVISVLSNRLDSTVILSEDKDFIQLVSDTVTLHRPMAKLTYIPDNFQELTKKVTAKQYLHFRAINGDTSDEIPGVPGFGGEGKRAHQLIDKYGSITNILKARSELTGKVMDVLFDSKDILIRNLMLMDLSYSAQHLPTDVSDHLDSGQFNESEIKAILLKYEFFSLLNSMKEFTSHFRALKQVSV